jgi:putative redox protein
MVKVRKAAEGKIRQLIEVRANQLFADEPPEVGEDQGPAPHELLDAALGACTAMTILLVARRKQWPLTDARVEITHSKDGDIYRMTRKVELMGELTAEQREYLLGIANKCPVHKTLSGRIEIATELA